ncbi:MAG: hypothetical protein V3T17_11275 [Pseudomonadales bacterium]
MSTTKAEDKKALQEARKINARGLRDAENLSNSAFGEKINRRKSHVSDIIGKNAKVAIGNNLARVIASAFKKPDGWLDIKIHNPFSESHLPDSIHVQFSPAFVSKLDPVSGNSEMTFPSLQVVAEIATPIADAIIRSQQRMLAAINALHNKLGEINPAALELVWKQEVGLIIDRRSQTRQKT